MKLKKLWTELTLGKMSKEIWEEMQIRKNQLEILQENCIMFIHPVLADEDIDYRREL